MTRVPQKLTTSLYKIVSTKSNKNLNRAAKKITKKEQLKEICEIEIKQLIKKKQCVNEEEQYNKKIYISMRIKTN